MFKNYFKVAFRNLLKNKTFSLINIVGLSIAVSFILAISAYIQGELMVNNSIADHDRVYLVRSKWKEAGMGLDWTTVAPLATALKTNYPDLVEEGYHHDGISSVVSRGDQAMFRERLQPGDASFFRIFGFPLIHGDSATALDGPYSLVITENAAKKYFGQTDVVGRKLSINSFNNDKRDFEIKGVLKDPPFNTATDWAGGTTDFFLSGSSELYFGRDTLFNKWSNAFIVNYVKLRPGVRPEQLQQPIQQLLKLHLPENMQRNLEIYLTPVKQYYMESGNGLPQRMIFILSAVTIFILLMATINFINITIGSSAGRLREIGVRKAMGGTRAQLVWQFLTESVLLTSFAVLLALGLQFAARGYFSAILGKALPNLFLFPLHLLGILLGLILLVGVLAGSYPAVVLSAQPTVDSLKGKLKTVQQKMIFRRLLITFQFVMAIFVFIASIVIGEQVSYFFHMDLGYDKESVITANLPRDLSPQGIRHMEQARDQFALLPDVAAASFSFEIPDGRSGGIGNIYYKESQDSASGVTVEGLATDEKFAGVYKIKVLQGVFLNESTGFVDSSNVVLNETAARAFGWKNYQDAIGKRIRRVSDGVTTFTVRGVVRDFHFGSLQETIKPIVIMHVRKKIFYRYLSLRLKPGKLTDRIAGVSKKWQSLFSDTPFDYYFMDDTIASLYKSEVQMKQASLAGTAICIFIVLLGVLGIVLLSIIKRKKEVAMRKVLGASVMQIAGLFVKEFSWSMVVANLIAWPVSYWLLGKWLIYYSYHITIGIIPFLLVAILLFTLISVTVVILTNRIAMANTIKNLKTE